MTNRNDSTILFGKSQRDDILVEFVESVTSELRRSGMDAGNCFLESCKRLIRLLSHLPTVTLHL